MHISTEAPKSTLKQSFPPISSSAEDISELGPMTHVELSSDLPLESVEHHSEAETKAEEETQEEERKEHTNTEENAISDVQTTEDTTLEPVSTPISVPASVQEQAQAEELREEEEKMEEKQDKPRNPNPFDTTTTHVESSSWTEIASDTLSR